MIVVIWYCILITHSMNLVHVFLFATKFFCPGYEISFYNRCCVENNAEYNLIKYMRLTCKLKCICDCMKCCGIHNRGSKMP